MRFTYAPFWKGVSRGTVICVALGLVAGLVAGLWWPDGLIVAAVLAVDSGIAIDQMTVIENSEIFVVLGVMGVMLSRGMGETDQGSYGGAEGFLPATPWQIVVVIPLQIGGYCVRRVIDWGRGCR
jgi:hypothetical protein